MTLIFHFNVVQARDVDVLCRLKPPVASMICMTNGKINAIPLHRNVQIISKALSVVLFIIYGNCLVLL